MHYKLKRAGMKGGKLYVTVADSNTRPLRYTREELYMGAGSLEDPVRAMLGYIADGNFRPLPSCTFRGVNLYGVEDGMWFLRQEYAPDISVHDDMLCGLRESDELCSLLAEIAESWLGKKEARPRAASWASAEDRWRVAELNTKAASAYAAARKKMHDEGVIPVRAAIYSGSLPDYDCLIDEDGHAFLGKRERYDNHGHYDNADGSAIYPSDATGGEAASALFSLFGYGHITENMALPDIRWERLAGIEGIEVARALAGRAANAGCA